MFIVDIRLIAIIAIVYMILKGRRPRGDDKNDKVDMKENEDES